jgi:BNR/Asp-box repeat
MVDPSDHRTVWAGVEIDGVFRSLDGGETWSHVETGLYDPDIHAMAIASTKPTRVFASTARELFISIDMGEKWQPLGVKAKWPLPYARGIAVKADDPEVLYAGCGETTTGEKGHVLRSTDAGQTWETLKLPAPANSTIWGLATHPAEADRVLAFSLFGEVYVSDDAGDSWAKIAREFGEIRAAAWLPD